MAKLLVLQELPSGYHQDLTIRKIGISAMSDKLLKSKCNSISIGYTVIHKTDGKVAASSFWGNRISIWGNLALKLSQLPPDANGFY